MTGTSSYNRYGATLENQEGYWEDFATLPGRQQDCSSTRNVKPEGSWENT